MKKHGDFCAHAFVKYANNLYASKILSLKIAITQLLLIFTNIRKIIINENLSKAHTDHSKSKSAISKIFRSTHFTQNRMNLPKYQTSQRQLVRASPPKFGLRRARNGGQNRVKMAFSLTSDRQNDKN